MSEPTLAEALRLYTILLRIRLGRLALRASRRLADLAERLLAPELRRLDR
jgi:hypothetical protein